MLTAVYIKVCSHWMQWYGAAWRDFRRNLMQYWFAPTSCVRWKASITCSHHSNFDVLHEWARAATNHVSVCHQSLHILTSLVSRVKFNGNVCRQLLWHSLVDNCGFLVANLLVQRSHSFTITKISGCWIWRTLFGRKSRKSLFVDWMHVYVYFVFWELSSFRLNWQNWCLWY